MTLPDVVDFASDLLVGLGALVERDEAGALVVAPHEVARTLDLPETCKLTVAPNLRDPASVSCGFGTPLLERLIEAGRTEVPVACASIADAPPRLSQARSLAERFSPRNGLAEVVEVGPGESEYIVSSFVWVAEADDRYEGLVKVVLSADDGAEPDEVFCGQVDLVSSSYWKPLRDAGALHDKELVARRLAGRVSISLDQALSPVVASVKRRHLRDHGRISEYFASMIRETLSARRRVDPETIRAKVDRLVLERDAKLRDLSARFGLRVSVRPAALIRLKVPCANIRVQLRRRKQSREIRLRLPALAQSLDQSTCDGCGATTNRPALCDERLHLLCERCVPSAQGRFLCPGCAPGSRLA